MWTPVLRIWLNYIKYKQERQLHQKETHNARHPQHYTMFMIESSVVRSDHDVPCSGCPWRLQEVAPSVTRKRIWGKELPEPQHCLGPTYPKLGVSSRRIPLSHMGQTLQNGVRLAASTSHFPVVSDTCLLFTNTKTRGYKLQNAFKRMRFNNTRNQEIQRRPDRSV